MQLSCPEFQGKRVFFFFFKQDCSRCNIGMNQIRLTNRWTERQTGGYIILNDFFFLKKVAKVVPRQQTTDRQLISRFLLTDRCAQPISARVQTRLLRQTGVLSLYRCNVNKARGCVVFENNGRSP